MKLRRNRASGPSPRRRPRLRVDSDTQATMRQSNLSYSDRPPQPRRRQSDLSGPSPRRAGRQLSEEQAAQIPNTHAGFRHFWLQRFGFIILLIAIVVSMVNVLSLSASAKVVPLQNSGSVSLLRSLSVYEIAADHKLSRSTWNRNKITINTDQLSHYLLNKFPELSSVSVTVPLLGHRPVIYVEPANPAFVLVANSGSFVIADNGKAVLGGTTPAALSQPKLPVVNDQSGLHIQLNQQAVPTSDVSFIQTIVVQLAAKQFTVSGMTLPAAASELDVHLAGQPYFVKFNLESGDPKGEAGTFLATIMQLQHQHITPSQYVDVRVSGRAYYK